jgi:hypothetical protein
MLSSWLKVSWLWDRVPVVRKIDRSICYDARLKLFLYGPLLLGLMLYMASAARGQPPISTSSRRLMPAAR